MFLADKTAIITGASSGIGRAAARLFAGEGAAVVLVARRRDKLEELAEEISSQGGSAVIAAGDVTEAETHSRAVKAAQESFGGLDIALNNAGTVGELAPLATMQFANWEHVLATNLTSGFLAAQAQIPAMIERGGGSLVFTGSFVGVSAGLPGMTTYGASKAGLLGLVKGITADYAEQGIRANALLPGGTKTEMAGSAGQQEWAAGLHAMKRLAEPEEIARAALFLASGMSSFVTGSALLADGGNAAVKL
ncbi:SDR family oxidoreductase [Alteraurantiacibacter aquimixticola]|uniref:SDR family oxidoreductase n=1 Tax=Alteraurantiacibacter aquimixticola TaxID=2489173 RepID=A0A4T3F0D8_9SPHN|nr:SDR family oxidoreductase [Alteraurantiacibacter aquimixticola]TIX48802.1 SDR family oxidoreductase [Alteraurantiacibacter aquimixticola]